MIEIVLTTAFTFVGFVMGRVAKFKSGPKHEHIWKVASSQHYNIYANDHATRPMQRTTRILKTCFCGDSRVDSVNGNWSLEEVRAQEL